MIARGVSEMSGIAIEATCKSCDMPGKISGNGFVDYCDVCGPYAYRDVHKIKNLAPWAREMIVQEGDILDDVEPISPPINDSQWLKLLQQVIPSDYPTGGDLPLEVAYEATRNYPKVEIHRVVEHGNGGTIFYSTENPDADDDYYIPQKLNEWNYLLDDEDEHPCQYDEHLPEALVENISGAFSNDPIKRVSQIKNMCKRVLHYDSFLIDPSLNGRQRRWCSMLPESMILRQALAEILLGHHGQEPLWRLRAGAINDTVYWKNYLSTEVWEKPRKKSFQYLRQIVEANSEIKPTPKGLVIQGESGANYLLQAKSFNEGAPTTVVLNLPSVSSLTGPTKQSVCIHMELGCKLPLGDRIAALALGLVNDIKTARRIEQLAVIVDKFQKGRWR